MRSIFLASLLRPVAILIVAGILTGWALASVSAKPISENGIGAHTRISGSADPAVRRAIRTVRSASATAWESGSRPNIRVKDVREIDDGVLGLTSRSGLRPTSTYAMTWGICGPPSRSTSSPTRPA